MKNVPLHVFVRNYADRYEGVMPGSRNYRGQDGTVRLLLELTGLSFTGYVAGGLLKVAHIGTPEEERYRAMTMFVGEDRFVESDSRRVNLATDFTQQELETLYLA